MGDQPSTLSASPRPSWRFGRVRFDEGNYELRVDGRVVEVERKPLEVLKVLLEHNGKVVTKSQLVQLAWPGRVIGDAALAKAIARLREAIGDADHQIVRTHHRYGYRLVADIIDDAAPSVTVRADAEHRVMTMMFCDLVDSTSLAETLDPETYRNLLLDYQRSTAEIVKRYEGHVAQQFGDGMLFYFGYPAAHDDDAERAVRCACELLRFAGRAGSYTRVEMRIGVHTGSIVIGRSGSGGEVQATGAGLNIASRLQALAEPNTALISDATFRLVPGLFVTRDFGLQAVRGVAEPMRVHQVLQPSGVRSRLDAQSRLTPFAGRQRELACVDGCWAEVQQGKGRALLFSGEPGIGKSRLLHELRSRLVDTAHTWLECRADALNRHSAFHVSAELLRRGFAIDPADEDARRLLAIERRLDDLGFARDDIVPLLAPLLDLADPVRYPASSLPAEARRARTLTWLTDWISRLADEQPLVLVFEDLHWCDESTLEFIGGLLARIEALPLLLVMTARPEFVAPWPRDERVLATQRLEGLERSAVECMLADLSGDTPLASDLRKRILDRAGGVPLFVEELVRGLRESGQVDAAVPQTLNSLIRARLDRLGPAQELMQTLSVIGLECDHAQLQRVSGLDDAALRNHVGRLAESGLLIADDIGSGAHYRFKHALIRDGAYAALLKSQRQALHGRAARAIETMHPTRLADHHAALAHHCEHAGQTPDAARYARLAGESAIRRSANHEAAAHLSAAIRLTESLDPTAERQREMVGLHSSLGVTLTALNGYTDPAALGAYERARALARDLVDCPDLAPVLSGLAAYHMVAARYSMCLQVLDELESLASRIASRAARVSSLFLRGQALHCLGRFDEADSALREAIAMHEREDVGDVAYLFQEDTYSSSIMSLAMGLWFQGRIDQAVTEADRGLAHARRMGHPFSLAIASNFRSHICQKRRDVEGTMRWARENIALSSAQSFPFYVAWSEILLGWGEAQSGQAYEGVARIRRAMQTFNGHGAEFFRSWAQMTLGEALAMAGRPEEGLHAIEAALRAVEASEENTYLAEIHRVRGEMLLQMGRPASEAEACFRTATDVARRQGTRTSELRAATSLAKLLQRQGRAIEAQALIQPLYAWFTEGLDTPDLIEARAVLESVA